MANTHIRPQDATNRRAGAARLNCRAARRPLLLTLRTFCRRTRAGLPAVHACAFVDELLADFVSRFLHKTSR